MVVKSVFTPEKLIFTTICFENGCIFASVKSNRRCETFTSSFTYTIYIRKIKKSSSHRVENSIFCFISFLHFFLDIFFVLSNICRIFALGLIAKEI